MAFIKLMRIKPSKTQSMWLKNGRVQKNFKKTEFVLPPIQVVESRVKILVLNVVRVNGAWQTKLDSNLHENKFQFLTGVKCSIMSIVAKEKRTLIIQQ